MSTSDTAKIWTILELITWGTQYLTEKEIDDARLTIELMLSHVLKRPRIQLYTKFDQPLSEPELMAFKELLKRRLTKEPLQYILGETEFMGLKFSVDRRVLIPRPETELLVERAIALIAEKFQGQSDIFILDIGTGSGCIAVSLAKMIPNATVVAMDVSSEALQVAEINALFHGVSERVQLLRDDILTVIKETFSNKFHCILSNPPYVSKKEYALVSRDVKDFEPVQALSDNADGLKYFPVIAERSKDLLIENGIVGVEHAFDQSGDVQKIFTEAGFHDPIVVKDYQGIDRHCFYSHTINDEITSQSPRS